MPRTQHLPWTVVGLLVAFVAGQHTASEPLVVKDSKGRVRLKTTEDGDAFTLAVCDHSERPRLTLGCGPLGFPVIHLWGEDGKDLGQWTQESAKKVSLVVRGPTGEPVILASEDGLGAALDVGNPDGPHVMLSAAEADGRTQLVLHQNSGKDATHVSLFLTKRSVGGLLFERGRDRVGGLNIDGEKGVLWFGQDALDKSTAGVGVRLGWDPSLGAMLSLFHEKAVPFGVQSSAAQGTGWQVGLTGSGAVRAGVSADGTPKLLVTDKDGASVLKVPEK